MNSSSTHKEGKKIKAAKASTVTTDCYMQVPTVLLPKPSTQYHSIVILLPRDDWLGRAKHIADQDGCLSFSNLSNRRQCVDEAWWFGYITDHNTES